MIEKPILSAMEAAEFGMRETHLDSYRRSFLAHLEVVNGKPYADEVGDLMRQIYKKRKGTK